MPWRLAAQPAGRFTQRASAPKVRMSGPTPTWTVTPAPQATRAGSLQVFEIAADQVRPSAEVRAVAWSPNTVNTLSPTNRGAWKTGWPTALGIEYCARLQNSSAGAQPDPRRAAPRDS